MFYQAKYIIHDDMTPVVFPETLAHVDVAYNMFGGKEKISGAGFCVYHSSEGWICYGESISLKIKSNGDADGKILNKMLGGARQ